MMIDDDRCGSLWGMESVWRCILWKWRHHEASTRRVVFHVSNIAVLFLTLAAQHRALEPESTKPAPLQPSLPVRNRLSLVWSVHMRTSCHCLFVCSHFFLFFETLSESIHCCLTAASALGKPHINNMANPFCVQKFCTSWHLSYQLRSSVTIFKALDAPLGRSLTRDPIRDCIEQKKLRHHRMSFNGPKFKPWFPQERSLLLPKVWRM